MIFVSPSKFSEALKEIIWVLKQSSCLGKNKCQWNGQYQQAGVFGVKVDRILSTEEKQGISLSDFSAFSFHIKSNLEKNQSNNSN